MKKIFTLALILIALSLQAQDVDSKDSEYFTADFTYDLVADRLTCAEQSIPLNFNERVYAFINYFVVKNRPYVKDVMEKSTFYFPLMEEKLAKYNLPQELKYLSIVESGLNPQAISRAGAGGLWQFMPYTGRSYGLHQDWYIDERFDPDMATEAACRYLSMLYNMFGDWELALAAYNSGPGNVRKAIRRSGYKKDFWEVYRYLPRETRSYVPQFVAVLYAFEYAEEHNFYIEDNRYRMASDTIMISGYLNLKTLANSLDICYDDLKSLNPNLKRFGIKTNGKNYPINLPEDKVESFRADRNNMIALAQNGQKDLEYMARNSVGSTFGRDKVVYKVRSGDVLGTIAERHKVRVSDIRKWNGLSGNLIRVGQRLNIWVYPGTQPTTASVKKVNPVIIDYTGRKVYTVQPGDTLWDIAKKYEDLNIDKIKKLNKLKSNKIMPGQKLIIG
jgi:membrane-bound lytic murein transglycosylase D